ncbi:hypothetical protein [Salegentibacter salegens]|uniref:Lipoprotein n=1 Tax=Salegentibacter salegens TaxID=143223 RepID=A0A1M7KVG7_9FLAO|nr:hypothetical protein [Salegentibacter salegens]PRX43828.1 hypothetical protein LY58_02239 [Salegentibacter salegens]SHM69548.1 hypothetical protein SAMN05878281_1624 [Salegentibacter salegens]
MKKTILTTLILSALIIGCKDTINKNNETSETTEVFQNQKEKITKKSEDQAALYNNTWVNEIEMDNGDKWEANLETNEGVEEMLKLVESSNPKSVQDYHSLALKLNEEKNYVVKECTMEGSSHDNLHVFLHPLIEKISALRKVSSKEEGAKITGGIKENLESYYDYFK